MRALLTVGGSLLFVALFSCTSFKPGPIKEALPKIQRGWSVSESAQQYLQLEASVAQISYSGPIVMGERVLYGSDRFGLKVVSARNGQEIWTKEIPGGLAAFPAVSGKKIFVGSEYGLLQCLDAEGGAEKWKISLSGPVKGELLVAADRLFVSTEDEALHAVDPSTGKVLWSYRRPSVGGTSIKGGGSASYVMGKIWAGFSDGVLVGLNPDSGAVEIEKSLRDNSKFMDLDAKVLGWRDGLLVVTYDGRLRYLTKDASVIWEFPAGGARAPIVDGSGTIYLPSSDGAVYAIEGQSGKELWKSILPRGVPTSISLVNGGKQILVGGSEERLFLLEAKNGTLLETRRLGRGSGVYAPIAVDQKNSKFYVLTNFSRLYEFQLNL